MEAKLAAHIEPWLHLGERKGFGDFEAPFGEGEIAMDMMKDEAEFAELSEAFEKLDGDFGAFRISKSDGLVGGSFDVDGEHARGGFEGGMDTFDFDNAAIAGSHEDGFGFREKLLGIDGWIVDHGLGGDLGQGDHEGRAGTESFPATAQVAVNRIETGGLADRLGEIVKIIHGMALRAGSLKGLCASGSYSIA